MNQQNELKTHNSRLTTYNAKLLFSYVPYSLHFLEHHCHVWAEFVCVDDWVVLRVVDDRSDWLKETEFEMSGKHYYTDEKNVQIVIALLKAHGAACRTGESAHGV